MPKFEAFVPVDLRVTLEARDAANAGDKADYTIDYFLKNASTYKLNLPGIGPVEIELVPAALEEGEDGSPDVHEVFETETQDKLGSLPPADISEPFYGTCLLPRNPVNVIHAMDAEIVRTLNTPNDTANVNLGGDLRGDEWGTAANHYVGG